MSNSSQEPGVVIVNNTSNAISCAQSGNLTPIKGGLPWEA